MSIPREKIAKDPRRLMNPDVEYRACPRIGDDRVLVGKDGTIWTYHSRRKLWKRVKGKVSNGCAVVDIGVGGRQKKYSVGPLVMSAFGVPRPIGCVCWHDDEDRLNNALSNLRWVPTGTAQVGKKAPHDRRGEASPVAVLSDEAVARARELYLCGSTTTDLADEFGVGFHAMRAALTGGTWSHVPGAVTLREPGSSRQRGSMHYAAIIDEDDIAEMVAMRRAGMTHKEIADRFHVHRNQVGKIFRGEQWRHVEVDAHAIAPNGRCPSCDRPFGMRRKRCYYCKPASMATRAVEPLRRVG